ncbi:SDR family oxidoreductase [Flavobacterium alkalisoli]|uniref:SDR family oxidoreductase n=1 Tax=Flavobacterium alkalisoli TaxID=2602769 RepID=A0A5B9FR82_9FLAO|nr:SDR family oxidoreductase [Flavobacterium alkalisoli]QEE48661.1 SDR family oxidoreductase [Flavobacterium alkalisoli]
MQISILGIGWLGLPLAQSLLQKGFTVKGSVTSAEKLELLKEHNIIPYQVSLTANTVEGDIANFLSKSDVLIINIPPKLRNADSENFTDKIKALIPYIEQSGIEKVLFVSSISVYGEKNAGIVTEETTPFPDTESGKQLLETEKLLSENKKFKTTLLRFAGLIGAERHPVYHLAGKENLPNANTPVNLIDRNDCVAVIEKIIEKNTWEETFNAASPEHPTRKEYYTKKAKELNLTAPTFLTDDKKEGKIISSEKITSVLGHLFNNL